MPWIRPGTSKLGKRHMIYQDNRHAHLSIPMSDIGLVDALAQLHRNRLYGVPAVHHSATTLDAGRHFAFRLPPTHRAYRPFEELGRAPASMTRQWQDELEVKFGPAFTIVDRDHDAAWRLSCT